MSEAPERIWVDACEAVNNAPSWIDELRVAHKDSYVNDDLSGQQYIRADIHEARVKKLEDRIKELELPADDDRSYAKGFTQGYSEGWDDGDRGTMESKTMEGYSDESSR